MDTQSRNERRFGGIFFGHIEVGKSASARSCGDREHAQNPAHAAVERKFSREKFSRRVEPYLFGGKEEREREGYIKCRACLFQFRGGKREHYLLVAPFGRLKLLFVARIFYCRRDTVLRLLHGFVGKPDDSKRVQAFHDIALDRDDGRLRQHRLRAIYASESRSYFLFRTHGSSLQLLAYSGKHFIHGLPNWHSCKLSAASQWVILLNQLQAVLYAGARGGICLKSVERNFFFARFADAIGAFFHFFERVHDVLVALFELFYERHIDRQFFYLVRRIVWVRFNSFTRGAPLPVARVTLHAAVGRQFFLDRIALRAQSSAQLLQLIFGDVFHRIHVWCISYMVSSIRILYTKYQILNTAL